MRISIVSPIESPNPDEDEARCLPDDKDGTLKAVAQGRRIYGLTGYYSLNSLAGINTPFCGGEAGSVSG
jgi:hypothetical protein